MMTSARAGSSSLRVLGCEETNGASKQSRKPINKKEKRARTPARSS